jgi:hypothetical protein
MGLAMENLSGYKKEKVHSLIGVQEQHHFVALSPLAAGLSFIGHLFICLFTDRVIILIKQKLP